MQAGRLNEVIEIFQPQIDKNEYGEQVQVYVKCYTTRAHVEYNSGNRNIENNEVVFNYNRTFHIRRYVQVNENYQIKWQGKYYRILSIEDVRPWNEKIIQTELINE